MCIHIHQWKYFQSAGLSSARMLRSCTKCSRYETLLIDYESKKLKWVRGNFLGPQHENIYIFTNSHAIYKEIVSSLVAENYGNNPRYIWVQDSRQIDAMKKDIHPSYLLAEDWYQMDIIQDPHVRTLFNTGHF